MSYMGFGFGIWDRNTWDRTRLWFPFALFFFGPCVVTTTAYLLGPAGRTDGFLLLFLSVRANLSLDI